MKKNMQENEFMTEMSKLLTKHYKQMLSVCIKKGLAAKKQVKGHICSVKKSKV